MPFLVPGSPVVARAFNLVNPALEVLVLVRDKLEMPHLSGEGAAGQADGSPVFHQAGHAVQIF